MQQNFEEFSQAENRVYLDLGDVTVGSSNNVVFRKTPECKTVKKLTTGCGCSAASDRGDSIFIAYVPGDIPDGADWHRTEKWVDVTYTDNSNELLYFGANVHKTLPVRLPAIP